MGANAWFFAVLVPAIFEFRLSEVLVQLVESFTLDFWRKAVFMQNHFGVGDAREKAADCETVAAEDLVSVADDLIEIDAVSLKKSTAQKWHGDGKANVFEIRGGCEVLFADLIDIKGEFGSDMGVFALLIGNDGAIFFGELGKFNRDGFIDSL